MMQLVAKAMTSLQRQRPPETVIQRQIYSERPEPVPEDLRATKTCAARSTYENGGSSKVPRPLSAI